ncbi:DUF4259 domain-containing protein [Micromonospora sp. H61]|uniref:DUF4259 domain-containing protein n=1 Tax=Micromonospora sp. H61 TaxID=2824888 RepID=UPI001B37F2F7|nr:DUF4259 domain-containing protein [Micromonospora sp. H61]
MAAYRGEGDVGTFGTGPFSSDGALDFLDELAERAPQQRVEALRHMLGYVLANRGLLWREYFPDQVVAAAALVATTLPGGEQLQHRLSQVSDDPSAVILPEPVPDLATSALDALLRGRSRRTLASRMDDRDRPGRGAADHRRSYRHPRSSELVKTARDTMSTEDRERRLPY